MRWRALVDFGVNNSDDRDIRVKRKMTIQVLKLSVNASE